MMIAPLIGMPQGAEWLVILVIVVLVFGASKLPDLARGSGQALRIFKAETKGLRDDDDTDAQKDALPPTVVPQAEQSTQATPQSSTTPRVDPIDKPQV